MRSNDHGSDSGNRDCNKEGFLLVKGELYKAHSQVHMMFEILIVWEWFEIVRYLSIGKEEGLIEEDEFATPFRY